MTTLKIGASVILAALIFIAAIAVNEAAGIVHAITIAVMGILSLVVMNIQE